MNRYAITLGVLTAATGALVSLQASATVTHKYSTSAAPAVCQSALPNFDVSFRKRPLAVVNEGSAGAFLTCGSSNPSSTVQTNAVEVYVVNRTAAAANMSCTMVDGIIDTTIGFANFYPKTISVGAGAFSNFLWIGPFNPGPAAQAVSCNVPASFEVNRLFTDYNDEIGA